MEGLPRNLTENILIGRFNDPADVLDLIDRHAPRSQPCC